MQEKILVIGKKGLLARSVINYLKIIEKSLLLFLLAVVKTKLISQKKKIS